jgi:AcrR family transcriptional regulator
MERRKQAVVDEIVRAAIDLFTRNGFEETPVDAIVEAAGCSRRTFYRYFGSKEDVLFYDLPGAFERLGVVLDRQLTDGRELWDAVSESVLELISRFPDDERPVQRMELWLKEPALQARYMQHVAAAESTIVDSLTRHRGTKPGSDDLAQIMAITAIGAYRTSVMTHPAGTNRKLTKHLRELLGLLDAGLGDR